MIKKERGPTFMRRLIPMTECPSCGGVGLIRGVFHQLECIGCHSSGFVCAKTLEPLLIQELVIQLGLMVRRKRDNVNHSPTGNGAQDQYIVNNRRGAGGTNYTGD